MGSRGAFLESGGFSVPAKWHTINYVDGYKVLEPKDPKSSLNLPERSNTPGTVYVLYRKDGTFSQLRAFGADRMPLYDIDYGRHWGKENYLHIHYFKNGERMGGNSVIAIEKHSALYKKYERVFKGVKV